MTGTITLQLDEKLQVTLGDLPEKMRIAALEVLREKAGLMVQLAKQLCPVDTGSLKKSIRSRSGENKVVVTAGGYITNPKTGRLVDYAVYAEAKQPFMSMAWNMIQPSVIADLESRIVEKVME